MRLAASVSVCLLSFAPRTGYWGGTAFSWPVVSLDWNQSCKLVSDAGNIYLGLLWKLTLVTVISWCETGVKVLVLWWFPDVTVKLFWWFFGVEVLVLWWLTGEKVLVLRWLTGVKVLVLWWFLLRGVSITFGWFIVMTVLFPDVKVVSSGNFLVWRCYFLVWKFYFLVISWCENLFYGDFGWLFVFD